MDIHSGLDIEAYTVGGNALTNGTYYVRARLRDANAEWSPWSEARSFKVEGAAEGQPALRLAKKVWAAAEPVTIEYMNGRGGAKDWIGIYRKGQTPGKATPSVKWSYVSGPSGRLAFSGLPAGVEYYAAFFADDGYVEVAPRSAFYVGNAPELAVNKSQFNEGERPTVTWSNAPGGAKDWVGVYRVGQEPGGVGSTTWAYTPSTSGSVTLGALNKGYYYAAFLINDAYFEISERVPFAVGTEISTVSLVKTALESGERLTSGSPTAPARPRTTSASSARAPRRAWTCSSRTTTWTDARAAACRPPRPCLTASTSWRCTSTTHTRRCRTASPSPWARVARWNRRLDNWA